VDLNGTREQILKEIATSREPELGPSGQGP
jgi:hypothetical protein